MIHELHSLPLAFCKYVNCTAIGFGLTVFLSLNGFLGAPCARAAVIWSESFESNGQCPGPNCRYTSSPTFNENKIAYWDRGRSNNFDTLLPYVGPDGTRFWAAERTDSDAGNSNVTQSIDFNPIDISNHSGLQFTGMFAATQEYFVDGGFPWNRLSGQGVEVIFQVDGGGYQNGVWFKSNGNAPPGSPTSPEGYLNLDLDFDGVGDSPRLTDTFTAFGFNIPDGNTLDIRIEVTADAASEEVAFDLFQVTGSLVSIIPGDMNGDLLTDMDDIGPLVLALTDRTAYNSQYSSVNEELAGDVNGDGNFNLGDLKDFKVLVSTMAGADAVPEPSMKWLTTCVVTFLLGRRRRFSCFFASHLQSFRV